jgi:glycosyltransferase involved in cell wall biosynthesis
VRAFAGLPDSASLLVVGDGPEREAVEATVEAAAVGDRVRLVGKVPHAEVPSYLRAMDIGVAPFERQASFYFSPLKVVEYLAAGLPVVATSQGELPELIGPAGVTVAPGSHAELAAALQRLVADDALRASLSRLAPRQVAERGWDRVAEQLETALVEEKVTA